MEIQTVLQCRFDADTCGSAVFFAAFHVFSPPLRFFVAKVQKNEEYCGLELP